LGLVLGLLLGLVQVLRVKSNPMHTASDAAMPPALAASGPLLLVVALLVLLYHGIAVKLVTDWYQLPDFSHGFLIRFCGIPVMGQSARTSGHGDCAELGGGVAGGLRALCAVAGRLRCGPVPAAHFVCPAGGGLVWTLLGRQMLGRVKFVLFVLLLAIPLPTILFNQITFPLQLLASRLATALLQLAQVPVLREGNVIQLPAMQLEVAEACSGIRSLISLFTVR